MKVMIVGNGGREYALAWKLEQSREVSSILCVPGNGATESLASCRNIPLPVSEKGEDLERISVLARDEQVDLAVIGPELPLIGGLADLLRGAGVSTFGPGAEGARLEGSKVEAKEFMRRHGVRTAESKRFVHTQREEVHRYLDEVDYPRVIKADGPAAGKGVFICSDRAEAQEVLDQLFVRQSLGASGSQVLIEEYLQGREVSVLVLCDGKRSLPLVSAMDHKRVGEGDAGPNTGGMGVIAPNPYFTAEYRDDFKRSILDPTVEGLRREGIDFRGTLFLGLMLTAGRSYLLEYNVRFGDPETQAILPLLEEGLAPLLMQVSRGELEPRPLNYREGFACNVVAAAVGYPGEYQKGLPVVIGEMTENAQVFPAGVARREGELVSSGGRVLSVTGMGGSLTEARRRAYQAMEGVRFESIYYRRDIGLREAEKEVGGDNNSKSRSLF